MQRQHPGRHHRPAVDHRLVDHRPHRDEQRDAGVRHQRHVGGVEAERADVGEGRAAEGIAGHAEGREVEVQRVGDEGEARQQRADEGLRQPAEELAGVGHGALAAAHLAHSAVEAPGEADHGGAVGVVQGDPGQVEAAAARVGQR
ncbi:MAG: hypothetical protein ACK559_40075, partial [bacterium]